MKHFVKPPLVFNKVKSLFPIITILVFTNSCNQQSENTESLPNVLLIVTENQEYREIEFDTKKNVETPNIDGLLEHSTIFSRFYVSPTSSQARASLLTGRSHLTSGFSNGIQSQQAISQYEITLAEFLKERGYRTSLFGKWYNGSQYPHHPIGQGFDTFFGYSNRELKSDFNVELMEGFERRQTTGHIVDALTDQVIKSMLGEAPFFSMVTYTVPQSPDQVAPKYYDKYKTKGLEDKEAAFCASMRNIDDNIGKLLMGLQLSGKARNTLVIFMSHREVKGSRFNASLGGVKSHTDAENEQLSLALRYPLKKWTTGHLIEEITADIDLFPTIQELVDASHNPVNELHGKSLISLIEGVEYEDRMLFAHQIENAFDTIPGTIMTNDFLLTLRQEGSTLYNLKEDPLRAVNIADSMPEFVDSLTSAYYHWFVKLINEQRDAEPIETGHKRISTVEFPVQEASVQTNTSFTGEENSLNEYVVNLSDSSMLTWETLTVADGDYEFQMQLSGKEGTEVVWSIGEDLNKLRLEKNLLKSYAKNPGKMATDSTRDYLWPTISLGSVHLEEGLNTIGLRFRNTKELEIKSLKLKLI